MRRTSAWFLSLCVILGLASSTLAQLGEQAVDPEQILKIKPWQPEARGEMESIVVDLRHRMPPVRDQSMGDCTAWAYGYAAKSYLEVVDQNWKADVAARQFSPRFLYNQLNKGEDKGVNPAELLQFMETTGCATLRTCPYVPGDYKGKPTAAAMEEAKLFRIRGHYLLSNGTDLRLALQQGHVCPISIRTNPVFNSGKYEVYTKELHTKGTALRKAGDKHGMHAMAAVGYDDKKGAFLLMNSWGADWGKAGYCWVAYDVLAKFNYIAKVETELVNFSVVLQDNREQVEVDPAGNYASAKPNKESLVVQVGGEYRGYDSASKRHQYFFSAWLTGQTKALDLIDSVDWKAAADNKVQSASIKTRDNYFRYSGTAGQNSIEMELRVKFKDGTFRDMRANITMQAPTAEHRQVELVFTDWYHGKWNIDGKPTSAWEWQVEVTGNLTDVNDIAKVTFNVGRMSRTEPVVTHEAEKFRAYSGGNIRHGGITYLTNPITADVFFRDGSRKQLSIIPVFKSPADDEIALLSDYREDGDDGENTWYSWTVRMKYPRDIATKIDYVKYELGPQHGDREVRVQDFYGGFIVTGAARREFRIVGTVVYNDGRIPLRMERWVELGRKGKFADPRRIEIETSDKYKGIDAYGRPTWFMTMKPMGDPLSLKEIEKVVYEMPEGYKPREMEILASSHPTCAMDMNTTKPTKITAAVHFKDGNFSRFNVDVTPRSPRDDRMSFNVQSSPHSLNNKPATAWFASFEGPSAALERLSAVDYRYRREGRLVRWLHDPGYHLQAGVFRAQGVTEEDGVMEAVVTLTDSSQRIMKGYISTKQIAHLRSPWTIEASERFFGYDNGIPKWLVTLEAVGTPEALAALEQVRYEWAHEKTGEPQWVAPPRAAADGNPAHGYRLQVYITRPTTFKVSYKRGGDTIDDTREARTTAPRTPEPILLKQKRFGDWPRADGTGTDYHWTVYLDGWEQSLREVKQVEYTLPKALGGNKIVVADRNADRHPGFAYQGISTAPTTIDALVTFKDGKTQKLYVQTGLPPEPVGVKVTDRYYGLDAEKKPQWSVTTELTGDHWKTVVPINWLKYTFKLDDNESPQTYDSPLFSTWSLWNEGGKVESLMVMYNDRSWKRVPINEPVRLKSPRIDLVTVKQGPGLTPESVAGAKKEWVAYLVGPEKNLGGVASASYDIALPEGAVTMTSSNRYGEMHEGFEVRYFAEKPVEVKAKIKFPGGVELPAGTVK
jgi:hypothetical protein